MATESKVLKGYVKTINMIWFVVLAFVLGFGGGIFYTIYQDSGRNTMMGAAGPESTPVTPQQRQMMDTLRERIKANPKDVDALTRLAHLYFDTNQWDLAIDAYNNSLTLEPERPDIWTDLGVMYRRAGDSEKAVEAFDRALAVNATHEIALFNKGVVLMHDLQDQQGALKAWETLIRINPAWQTPGGQSVKELVDELKKNLSS